MQSKYKVGLLRFNLMVAAVMPALMTRYSTTLTEQWLLWLAAGWLGLTAMLVEFSHRRPALVPWQLLPSLLLAALLWTAPERYPLWLWAWAALIMLPQPTWMAVLNAVLATLTWGRLAQGMPVEHIMVSGLVLTALMLLGLIRSRDLAPPRGLARRRLHLIPGLRLWPSAQLSRDLTRERARARREGVHCELLLLRVSRQDLWSRAQRLCELTRPFEHCYRLDGRTLGALLLSRDEAQARRRRRELQEALGHCLRLRAIPLPRVVSLSEECRALERQVDPITVINEIHHV